jgi:hypothetical protein
MIEARIVQSSLIVNHKLTPAVSPTLARATGSGRRGVGRLMGPSSIYNIDQNNATVYNRTDADLCPACGSNPSINGSNGHVDSYTSVAACKRGAEDQLIGVRL